MPAKYSIGVDFGTLSARALLVDVADGSELATATMDYPHAVMDECLPDGTRLKPDWALEHPQDYLDAFSYTVKEVLRLSNVDARDVVGISIDFTACTMVSIDKDGTPLCLKDEFKSNPYAYVMLWKHHGAQYLADRINDVAREHGEKLLERYGNKSSSEWMLPKIWQILLEAPDVYAAADRFIEAGDWVTMLLTGKETRNSCCAGYKAMWSKREGYPSHEFLKALDPRLETLIEDKLSTDIYPQGTHAGNVTAQAAQWSGLVEGTAVAVANIDAHVSLPPVGLTEKGKMLMIMGTSTCDVILSDEEKIVPGICGMVEDGVIPGLFGYEAGQTCVGDHFNWFVENCVPENYKREAEERGISLHVLLTEKAQKYKPGETGLLALDWWNGNRSVLVDANLTGMMLGMTLTTKPEEMYRALVEATAYGARMIVDTFNNNGVHIDEIYACGGISQKNPFMMQIYADVLGYDIRIARSTQTPALGAAMFGAVAAGAKNGGYDTIVDAARHMGGVKDVVYRPIPENREVYEKLYHEYSVLHDYFGRGDNDVMKRLKDIKRAQSV